MITSRESKSHGGIQAVKGAVILFVIFELVMLYSETKGDVVNGILVFIDAQLNGIFLLFVVLYFLMMYFTGRQAGFSVAIKNKPAYQVGILYGLSVSLFIVLFQSSLLLLFRSHDLNYSNKEIGLIAIRNFFILLITQLPVWLWIVHKIRAKITAVQINRAANPGNLLDIDF